MSNNKDEIIFYELNGKGITKKEFEKYEETLLDDVKKRNRQLRIESIQNMKNGIKHLEDEILLKRKFIKLNEDLMDLGY